MAAKATIAAALDMFWHKTLGRPYRLYSRDYAGNGEVVVLLHGIAASSDRWSELIPLLTPHYRVISLDLLGFGRSPKPQWYEYRIEQHVRHIEAALKRLGLRNEFILVGHSLGSLLATRYASQHPRAVKRLLLLSPPVYAPLDTITSKVARERTALYFRLYRFFRIHPRITPENFNRLKRLLPLPRSVIKNPATWVPFERTLEHCIEQQTIIADIGAIQAPTSIFYGTLDSVIVPYNIRLLTGVYDVRIIRLSRVNHEVGKRYARAVAEHLIKT